MFSRDGAGGAQARDIGWAGVFGTSEVTCQARQVIASGQAHENVEGSESAEAASGLIYSQCAKSHA